MQATVFIIGSQKKCFEGLMDASLDIGFRTILNFTDIEIAEQQVKRTPLCFFLFSLDGNLSEIPKVAKAIRFNRKKSIRFAPMIGFTQKADQKTITACLQFGFDDIVAAPFDAQSIMLRLRELLNKQITFYETKTYFGPDRRRTPGQRPKDEPLHPKRGDGGDHREIIINRNIEIGITILSDEFKSKDKKENEQTLEEATNELLSTLV